MSKDNDHEALGRQLAEKLGKAEGTNHAALRSGFLERVKSLTQKTPHDQLKKTQEDLEELCALFFEYNQATANNMATLLPKGTKDHPDAGLIKTQAGAITRGLQKSIIGFAFCEMELYATIALVDADIKEKTKEGGEEHKDMQLPNDLPQQIAVAIRRRDAFSEYIVYMRRAMDTLKKLDPVYTVFEGELNFLLGDEPAKKLIDDFNGLLRKMKFLKAEELIEKIHKKDSKAFFRRKKKMRAKRWTLVLEISHLTAGLLQKVAKQLKGREDILYLRSEEMKLAYEDMESQLEKTNQFLDKYEVPEIRFRRDALGREKDRLYEIGTFEEFVEILENIQKGCALPMTGLKDVRNFEENYYKKAQRIMDDKSLMIGQSQAKIQELSKAPDPESVPDSVIFSDEGRDEVEQFLAT